MLTVSKIKSAVAKACQKYGVKSAYLFGSYAKNTANDSSDVDLIVDLGEMTTRKAYFGFLDDLESELGTEVEVGTRESVSPNLFNLIQGDMILLYGN